MELNMRYLRDNGLGKKFVKEVKGEEYKVEKQLGLQLFQDLVYYGDNWVFIFHLPFNDKCMINVEDNFNSSFTTWRFVYCWLENIKADS